MAKVVIRHTYDCDEETFWKDILYDEAFNHRLYLEHLQFKAWKVERFEETDAEIRRAVTIQPVTGELPGPLAKLVGDNLGFREESVFDKATRRYKLRIIPNRLADKLRIEGVLRVEGRGEGRCERILELDVEAKVFGLGSMIESRIIADTQQSYDKGAAFGQRMLAERKG